MLHLIWIARCREQINKARLDELAFMHERRITRKIAEVAFKRKTILMLALDGCERAALWHSGPAFWLHLEFTVLQYSLHVGGRHREYSY